ncbi:aldo/keto reductase [Microbacterium sp. SSW1-59]|uniref:aldo/keto reductase n=1 Tax=Microbacterium xanthum TaxID=3079794 RepID=UPI002AD3A124|nr:aldo/keto reductase [Microbacterium sp. SSW1-59]MDZ8201699.1 aldo/keto reductase [Microbacterium sp. SSW1-59]
MGTSVTPQTLRGHIAEGCGRFSTADARDDANALTTIRAAYDAGVRVFDTARAYATVDDDLHNEHLLAEALRGREDVVIMTKGGHFRTGPTTWGIENTVDRVRRDVEASLRALGRERLDMYYLHRADGAGDLEGVFVALEALRRDGTIGAIGISNATVEQIDLARSVCRLSAVQNRLVAVERTAELAHAERHGLAFFAYSPLGGPAHARDLPARLPALASLARERGVGVHRLALRGMLANSPALSVIVGMGTPCRAAEGAAAMTEEWDAACATAWKSDTARA